MIRSYRANQPEDHPDRIKISSLQGVALGFCSALLCFPERGLLLRGKLMTWMNQRLAALAAWIRENLAGLVIALISLTGAYLGASYGSTTQLDIWRREKSYQTQMDVLNKRVELVRSIARSNVVAQRVSILMTGINAYSSALEAQLEQCKRPNPDAQTIAYCAHELKGPIDIVAANKEISDVQGDYFASLQLAAVYFCDKTRSAIHELQEEKKNWWEADEKKRDGIVVAMASELGCGMDLKGLFK
jgi:hypothetical protein